MASGHSSHCDLLYSDLLLIPNSEREAFPTPKHQEGLEHCLGAVPCSQAWLSGWLPWEWGWVLCLLLEGNGASSLGRLLLAVQACWAPAATAWRDASCGSHASDRVYFWFVLFCGFLFSLNKGNLIFHYLRHCFEICLLRNWDHCNLETSQDSRELQA